MLCIDQPTLFSSLAPNSVSYPPLLVTQTLLLSHQQSNALLPAFSCSALTFLISKISLKLHLQSSIASSEPQGDQEDTETALLNTIMPQDFSLLLTFIYDGHVVGSAQVKSLDCRLVAEPHSSQGVIEQVFFPKPDPLEPTQSLLNQLKRGVLVASNCRGLSVRNLCPIPISWNSPQAPLGPGPHILPSNKEVELFKTTDFCKGEVTPTEPLVFPLQPPS